MLVDAATIGEVLDLKTYENKREQITANVGWVYTANNAITEPCAAVELVMQKRNAKGKWENVTDSKSQAVLDLIQEPNAAHLDEELLELHYSYMNFNGESYILMRGMDGQPFVPAPGKLPAALEVLPAHDVDFRLGDGAFSASVVRYGQSEFKIESVIRSINPDPVNPYNGRSFVTAAAATIDTDIQMKDWNRGFFKRGAQPSLVFSSNEPLTDEAYQRWKEQFTDQHTGTANAHKPLLIEGGDVKQFQLSQRDLDFLGSRKFSRDELLAMLKVSPAVIGLVENVNKANADTAFTIHAVINVRPRVRRFCKQVNASLVKKWDPSYRLWFIDPVPEDAVAKLNEAKTSVSSWATIDEVRELYGRKPLPDGQGKNLFIPGTLKPIDAIINPPTPPAAPPPAAPGTDKASKSLIVKQIAASDYPDLYDDIDLIPEKPGCIMLDVVPLQVGRHVDSPEEDLIVEEEGEHAMGLVGETEPHVTLLYGLLENGNIWKDKVDELLSDWELTELELSYVDYFKTKDAFAIVAHVKLTPELVDGHERLTLLPHINTFSEYKPHITLAYVKPDPKVASKWIASLNPIYKDAKVSVKGINYGAPVPNSKALEGVKKNS